MTDLLLLNASNYVRLPIYAYAFVQLRALARTHGLQVDTFDFLGIPPDRYRQTVARLIERTRPRMIGLHLRPADSVLYASYDANDTADYFPVEDSTALIAAIREVTDIPVVVGGFGFTTHAPRLFDVLGPDLGVTGEPDDFLARFDDVLAGRDLHTVGNLMFRRNGLVQQNPRQFHDPLDEREYDSAMVAELEAFYGRSTLYGPTPPTVAVELARGCPYACYFCTEPAVKGKKVRHRDLDVVMDDVEFLLSEGVGYFWMICSELNIANPDLALQVAERFIRLNENGRYRPARWRAYHLPRWLSRDDLEVLYRSGFTGGWNDFPSLDDENLKRTRVPYRAEHALAHLHDTLSMQPTGPYGEAARFSVFLGNAYATPETVARSLKAYNQAGLADRFASAHIPAATRVFAPDGQTQDAPGAVTFRRSGSDGEIDVAHPTFFMPPAILAELGSKQAVLELWAYVESTLLSHAHLADKDWHAFLATSAPVSWSVEQLAARPASADGAADPLPAISDAAQPVIDRILADATPLALEALLRDPAITTVVRREVGEHLCRLIGSPAPTGYIDILDDLRIESDESGTVTGSSYDVLVALLERYDTVADLLADVAHRFSLRHPGLEIWLLRRMVFEKGIVLKPEFRPFLLLSGQSKRRQVA